MNSLPVFLNRLFVRYHSPEFLASDPLEFAHRYADPWDQEAVALISALLAYGNVKQIRRSVEDALRRIHQSEPKGPAAFVRALNTPRGQAAGERAFKGFVHRFNVGEDLVTLFRLLGRSWREHGSLGAHFMKHLREEHADIGPALDGLIADWWKWEPSERTRKSRSFGYLLTAPADGSCCKRWCMFLRWMGRADELDLGLWSREGALRSTFPEGRFLRTDQLIIPLDTHTGRISRYLGLTERKSVNWLAAIDVTRALRAAHAEDPTRYDFAMARLGILDLCQKTYRVEICEKCDLLSVCRFAQSHGGARPAATIITKKKSKRR